MPTTLQLLLSLTGSHPPLVAVDSPPPAPPAPQQVRAIRLGGGQAVMIDGLLNEPLWQSAERLTGFTQRDPNQGAVPTESTVVYVAYDDAALYIGARLYDSHPDSIVARLARRDQGTNSDRFQVFIDPYHDKRSGFYFGINAAGTLYDGTLFNDDWDDDTWDGVWEGKVTRDATGWTAELRIPYSQLRFVRKNEYVWGINFRRDIARKNEFDYIAYTPRDGRGFVSRFPDLVGIERIEPPRRLEVMPYVTTRAAFTPHAVGDPFNDGSQLTPGVGADARIGLGSNLTLNATVNPDFGQVEVDPAVVNLSDVETFFEERRPFFVEGAGYFGFGGLNCYFCSNVSSLGMFYTRRIGRPPQAPDNVDAAGGVYADQPHNTAILGAAKLTGRTPSGWSIGALDAVTRRERAAFRRSDGSGGDVTVEPFTNYFVAQVAKDLRGGATVLRAIGTSVVRELDDPFLADRLSRHAESFGLGTEMWFGKREYRLMAQLAGTQVAGDTAAMLRLQTASARYFQRPDRGNGSNGLLSDAYDPALTALRGVGAYARFARESGHLLWELSTNVRTPGFENNDISFLNRADYWWMSGNIFPQWTKPTRWYRQLLFIAGGQQQYNFDGDLTDRQLQLFGFIQPHNYWDINAFWIHWPSVLDDRLSRGGPVLRRPGSDFWSTNVNTDSRKDVVLSGSANLSCNRDGDCSPAVSLSVQLRPASNLSLSLGPSVSHDANGYQYVTTVPDPTATAFYGNRYVFADLVQNSLAMNARFNVTFSPNLTLELFMQPLIASGDYSRYKEFAAPRGLRRLVYGVDVGTDSIMPGNASQGVRDSIFIDPDGGGPATRFVIVDPSFTLRSLRGNAVLRWEYRPGSTLYLVWTRSGSSSLMRGAIDFGDDARALFRGPSENIFLVKVNYWLGI